VYLVDGQARSTQEARESDAVGAGALDAERDQAAVRSDVVTARREQRGEPGQGRRDEHFCQAAAESVEQNCNVFVFVGVDTDDDIVAAQLHAGHGRGSPSQIPVRVPLVGRADRTAMGPDWVRLL
jgi:hypothetical protein